MLWIFFHLPSPFFPVTSRQAADFLSSRILNLVVSLSLYLSPPLYLSPSRFLSLPLSLALSSSLPLSFSFLLALSLPTSSSPLSSTPFTLPRLQPRFSRLPSSLFLISFFIFLPSSFPYDARHAAIGILSHIHVNCTYNAINLWIWIELNIFDWTFAFYESFYRLANGGTISISCCQIGFYFVRCWVSLVHSILGGGIIRKRIDFKMHWFQYLSQPRNR